MCESCVEKSAHKVGAGTPVSPDRWFTYDVVATDPGTHARAGVLHTPHGDVPHAHLHAGRHRGHGQGHHRPTPLERPGRQGLAERTPTTSRSAPAPTWWRRWAASTEFMQWRRPHPHRLRRLPGLQPRADVLQALQCRRRASASIDYDGSWVEWSPEKNMEITQKLGADIVMQLDQCVGYPAPRSQGRALGGALQHVGATAAWPPTRRPDQALFGIVQGGMHLDLRLKRTAAAPPRRGAAAGRRFGRLRHRRLLGGRGPRRHVRDPGAPSAPSTCPRASPRYLMGVGNPTTLVRGGAPAAWTCSTACCPPARRAPAAPFSSEGRLNLRHARFAHDHAPLDAACGCPTCTGGYTRAYLHHLVTPEGDGSAPCSSPMHNVWYLLDLMRRAREAIIAGTYADFVSDWMASPAARTGSALVACAPPFACESGR